MLPDLIKIQDFQKENSGRLVSDGFKEPDPGK